MKSWQNTHHAVTRRSLAGQSPALAWWHKLGIAVVLVIIICAAAGLLYIRAVDQRYDAARDSAYVVRDRFQDGTGSQNLQLDDLPEIEREIVQLQDDLDELDSQIDTPILGSVARNTPFVSARMRASEDLLELGIELTAIAREATEIANEAREAFETNGLTGTATGPTWLDVVLDHREEIEELERRYDRALASRQDLDVENLPQRGKSMLESVDQLLDRATGIRDEYFDLLPLLGPAFGADEDARYFVLLQSGQEIRPAGGFTGTYAMVTISNGRLVGFDIERIEELDTAYVEQRETPISAPGPIQEYLTQEEWLPRDANWLADFPATARTLHDMYQTADWPELQGILAVNDSVIARVLEIVGSYQATIQGEQQTVTADSFMELIQSYRDDGSHKDVVGVLGSSLVEQIGATDFETKKQIYFDLREAANRREIQVYMLEPRMQEEAAKRGWDGALIPDGETPTLAMTVANLTGNKASDKVHAYTGMTIESGSNDGYDVTWTIEFDHEGDPDGNTTFNGFHRTWLQIYLPEGAELTSSSREPEPPDVTDDEDALGYNIELMPGTQEELTLDFHLPASTDAFLLRRQPGLNDVLFDVSGETRGCSFDAWIMLDRDHKVDLGDCTVTPAR